MTLENLLERAEETLGSRVTTWMVIYLGLINPFVATLANHGWVKWSLWSISLLFYLSIVHLLIVDRERFKEQLTKPPLPFDIKEYTPIGRVAEPQITFIMDVDDE